jgi:biotin carboxylase
VNSDDLAAVFTAGADPIITVARAAEAAGCYGIPVEIAETCADKAGTRNALWKNSVPQPEYTQVWSSYEITSFIRDRGPGFFVVKALASSGSRGHTRGRYGDFMDDDFANDAYLLARKYSHTRDVLVEEWLDGTVLSVETLWYNGVMIPLNAVERPFDGVIELGHYNPLVTDAEAYAAIWDVMGQAGRAVGMGETQGGHIFKGDLIITDEGPKVIELTTRLSGGFDSGWTSPLAHGVDYTKGALLLALGRPLEEAMPYFTPRWYRHAACMAVFGPKEGGVIKEIRGLDEIEGFTDEVIVVYQVGDKLPPLTDCTQRVAYCITSSNAWDIHNAPEHNARIAAQATEVICE